MNLLLDTHIWIWNHLEPWRVSARVHAALSDARNELWLSPVSIWELGQLLRRGRIRLRWEFGSWLEESVRALQLREASFTWRVAAELKALAIGHEDPADRFLVATAKTFDLTLVTADERLISVPGLKVLANR
jgi:PIN domain nuclease of toxin-antitoxin system